MKRLHLIWANHSEWVIAAVVLVLMAIVVGGDIFSCKHQKKTTAKITDANGAQQAKQGQQPQQPSPPPPPSSKTNVVSAEQISLGTIHKGEGIEHALIRQLRADPGHFKSTGDPTQAASVKKWAGNKAHAIALNARLVDGEHGVAEIRVKCADCVAYVLRLDENEKIQIDVYQITTQKADVSAPSLESAKSAPNGPLVPTSIEKVSTDSCAMQINGDTHQTLPSFEYLYIPGDTPARR